MSSIKMIKPDAIIEIKIGTGFLQKLQNVTLFLTRDLTPEQLENYKNEAETNTGFSEEWMDHVTTMGTLLKELENNADLQGFSFDQEVTEE
jgi:hypothetical protein